MQECCEEERMEIISFLVETIKDSSNLYQSRKLSQKKTR